MYCKYPPNIHLRHLIEAFWVSDVVVVNTNVQRILPDGCVDIIFNFTNNDGTGRLRPFTPYVFGTLTSCLDVTYHVGAVQMLGIRFRPNGIAAFTKMPIFELTDKAIEMNLIETLFDRMFYERLPELRTMKERVIYLESYLINRLSILYITEKRIDYAVAHIRRTNGGVPVRQIAREACLSERQLERNFKSAIGISPKTFSRIVKFKYTVDYLRSCPEESLYSASLECGYFDHSHLIKDFKEFGGVLPKELI